VSNRYRSRRLQGVENVVLANGSMHVGTSKSHEQRLMAVPHFVADAIAERAVRLKPHDLLFPAPTGGYRRAPNSSAGKKSWWLTALKTAELPRMGVHGLRHTSASLMVSAGANVKAVQKHLGHKSAAMTLDVYADLFDDDLDGVADALEIAAMAVRGGQLR